jgi:GAF domain-containing protein
MFAQIRQFFTFAGHYENTDDNRKARLIHAILLTMGIASFLILILLLTGESPTQSFTTLGLLLFLLAIAGLISLLRRGYLQLTAVLSLILLFVGGTLDAAAFSGIYDPGMTFLIVVIALAALLLGGRAAMITAGLSCLAGLFVHYAQTNTWLFTFTPITKSTLGGWLFLSVVMLLGGLVLRSAVNSLNDALTRLAISNKELETTRASLEERVAARTRDLEQAGEIGRRLAQIRELDQLLEEAAALIQQRFNLNTVQIYLVGPARRNLVLRARSGPEIPGSVQPGGRVSIALGTAIGTVAVERQPMVTTSTPSVGSGRHYRLAETTEVVIPLVAGAQLTGVIQMHSNQSDRLTRDTMPAFGALASELAIAIENATLFTEVTAARAAVEAQAHRLTRAGWEEFLNAIERSERVGYAYDGGSLTPVAELPPADSTKEVMTSLITVTGVPIGAIQLMRDAGQSWTQGESNLIEAVAQRVAQQVENLRLLAEAERYRREAEQASRRLTREGWAGYFEQAEAPAGYLYNQNEVLPLEGAGNGNGHAELLPLQHSLVVRGEPIGDLEVIHSTELEPEANELAAAVAQRLSAHIENLRLAEQREKALSETEEQAERLALLNELGQELSQATTQNEVFKVLASRLNGIVGGNDVAISLLDATGEAITVLQLDKATGDVAQVYEMQIAGTALSEAVRERRIVLQSDVQLDAYPENTLLLQYGIRATLIAPLIIQGRPIGAVSVLSQQVGGLDERGQNLLGQVASLLAATLESRRLVEQLQGALHKTEALYEASSALLSSDNLEMMLQGVVDGAVTALQADAVVLLNFDNERQEVASFLAGGPGKTNIQRFSYEMYQEGLSGWVLREKRPALSPKGIADERESEAVQKRRNENGAGAIVVVPLLYRGEAVGTVTAVNREDQRDFTQEDVDLMVALANQAAVAIENRRLFAQTQAALNETEVRARYQANIAEAVALLSGYGSQAIADVLRLLGEAAQVSRVYYFETLVDEEGAYWRQVAEWCAPGVTPQIDNPDMRRVGVADIPFWAESLQKDGLIANLTRNLPAVMQEILKPQDVLSIVVLAVSAPGRPVPGFLGFDETLYEREWSRDEIAALHTAGSALSNTIIREHLFEQVQESLEETENLYQASAALNIARSYDEVLAAMREHTILGQESQNVSVNYFERPWQEGAMPEWVDVLTRWSQLPQEAVSPRYSLAPFSSAATLLTAEAPALIEDIANDERLDENLRALYLDRFGGASTIFVPLAVGGQWFGYINAIYQQPTLFPGVEVRRLMALARQAAVAVQSIRLLEETNRLLSNETRQRMHADTLVRAAGRMSGVLNENQIRQVIVDEIYNVLLPDQIALYLWDKEASAFRVDLRVLAAPGHDEDNYTVGGLVSAEDRPDLWKVYNQNKSYLEGQPQPNQLLREHYCLPYLVGDDVEGVVELYHTARGATIRSQDQTLCENVVQQAALRLQNTRLFWQASERAEEMSAINEVARAVSRQMDQVHLIETVYEQVRRVMAADAFYVGLYNSETNEITFPVVFDDGERFLGGDPHPPRGKTLELIEHGQPILQNWTQEEWEARHLDPATLRIGQENKVSASLMFVPLQIGRRIIGVMSAQSYRFNVYGQGELALLAGIANHVAVAIENADLFQQTQARAEELAILNEMGRDLTGSLDLASVNQNVHHYTSLLMDTTNFYIAYYNEESDEVTFPLAYENGQQVQWRSRRLGKGMTEYVVRNRQSLFIEQNVEGWLAQHGVDSIGSVAGTWLGVPLTAGPKVIGIIAVQHERSGIYQERHRELLTAVASQTSIAVENARLFKQTEVRAEELAILNEMSRALSATLDVDDVLDRIYEHASRLLDATNFYVSFYYPELDEIEFALDITGDDVIRHRGRRQFANGLTEHLIRTGRPLLIAEGLQEEVERLGLEVLNLRGKSWIGVPMGFGKQAIGTIVVQSYTTPRLYSEHDRELLSAIASQATIAIQNARSFENATNARREAEERLRETAALQQLSQSLARTLQVSEILDIFFRASLDVIGGFDYIMLSLVDKQQQRVSVVGGVGVTDSHIKKASHSLDSSDIMADIIRTGQTELITGWDERFDKETFESEGHEEWVRVFTPVSLRQENVGVVEAGFRKGGYQRVHESQINLLKAFISQTVLALDNAKRYEASQQTARREQILREVTARVRNSADVDTILRTAAQEVSRALGRKSFVYLGNGETQSLVERTEGS